MTAIVLGEGGAARAGTRGCIAADASPRLAALLRHVDLLSPLEEFDASLLLTAELLGLRHVQHHRVNTCVGTLSEREDLDDAAHCRRLEKHVRHCRNRLALRRAGAEPSAVAGWRVRSFKLWTLAAWRLSGSCSSSCSPRRTRSMRRTRMAGEPPAMSAASAEGGRRKEPTIDRARRRAAAAAAAATARRRRSLNAARRRRRS